MNFAYWDSLTTKDANFFRLAEWTGDNSFGVRAHLALDFWYDDSESVLQAYDKTEPPSPGDFALTWPYKQAIYLPVTVHNRRVIDGKAYCDDVVWRRLYPYSSPLIGLPWVMEQLGREPRIIGVVFTANAHPLLFMDELESVPIMDGLPFTPANEQFTLACEGVPLIELDDHYYA